METIKALFVKPDPQAQVRKCNILLRSNMRKLDRDLATAKTVQNKTKNFILAADRRATREPQRAAQARKEARDFASELVRARKAEQRLVTGKAQLASVQMQVNEAFALRKIEGNIKASVGVMRDVRTLVSVPELAGTMRELSLELMKAGVIEEMVGDVLPEDRDGEDLEAEEEIDKVLGEILKDKIKMDKLPSAPTQQRPVAVPQQPVVALAEDDEDEDVSDAALDQMRQRLDILRS